MSRTFRDRPHWYQNIFPTEKRPLERDEFYNGYDGRYGSTNMASEHPSGDDGSPVQPGKWRKFSKHQHAKIQRRIGRETIGQLMREFHESHFEAIAELRKLIEEDYHDPDWDDPIFSASEDIDSENIHLYDEPFDPFDEIDYDPHRCSTCGQRI